MLQSQTGRPALLALDDVGRRLVAGMVATDLLKELVNSIRISEMVVGGLPERDQHQREAGACQPQAAARDVAG